NTQIFARRERRQGSVTRQKVSGFTDWTHHIKGPLNAGWIAHNRDNLMLSAIEGRPNQVIHCRINNAEALVCVALAKQNASQQSAGRGDDRTSWLKQQVQVRTKFSQLLQRT